MEGPGICPRATVAWVGGESKRQRGRRGGGGGEGSFIGTLWDLGFSPECGWEPCEGFKVNKTY